MPTSSLAGDFWQRVCETLGICEYDAVLLSLRDLADLALDAGVQLQDLFLR